AARPDAHGERGAGDERTVHVSGTDCGECLPAAAARGRVPGAGAWVSAAAGRRGGRGFPGGAGPPVCPGVRAGGGRPGGGGAGEGGGGGGRRGGGGGGGRGGPGPGGGRGGSGGRHDRRRIDRRRGRRRRVLAPDGNGQVVPLRHGPPAGTDESDHEHHAPRF